MKEMFSGKAKFYFGRNCNFSNQRMVEFALQRTTGSTQNGSKIYVIDFHHHLHKNVAKNNIVPFCRKFTPAKRAPNCHMLRPFLNKNLTHSTLLKSNQKLISLLTELK